MIIDCCKMYPFSLPAVPLSPNRAAYCTRSPPLPTLLPYSEPIYFTLAIHRVQAVGQDVQVHFETRLLGIVITFFGMFLSTALVG
jgi:hypothetical protein